MRHVKTVWRLKIPTIRSPHERSAGMFAAYAEVMWPISPYIKKGVGVLTPTSNMEAVMVQTP